jgi:hypothetical protein
MYVPKSFEDFIEYFLDSTRLTPSFDVFLNSMIDFGKLLETDILEPLTAPYHRLIYAGVFSAMETYLFDTLLRIALEFDWVKSSIINNSKIFDRKYYLSEINEKTFSVDEEIVKKLSSVLWHNLDKVREIYRSSIGIKFPDISDSLREAVVIRHDVVHRSGKDTKGNERHISKQIVLDLIGEIELFIYEINHEILEIRKKHTNA